MHNLTLKKILDRCEEEGRAVLPMHVKYSNIDDESWAIDIYDLDLYECETALYASEKEYLDDLAELHNTLVQTARETYRLEKVVDASTSLLSDSDKDCLKEIAGLTQREDLRNTDCGSPFRVYDTAYGFIVYIYSELQDCRDMCKGKFSFSKTFWAMYERAVELDCILINYDADA